MKYNPFIIIISAPSGAGKTSVTDALLDRDSSLKYSISATTRSRREGEVDGRDYFFSLTSDFEAMIDRGEFAEWAFVHNNYYGTPDQHLQEQLKKGYCIVMDIDIQGARQIRVKYPAVVSIFIVPPSFEVLESRLRDRGTESEEVVQRRLGIAKNELRAIHEYQYVVANNELKECIAHTEAIILAEKSRISRSQNPFLK